MKPFRAVTSTGSRPNRWVFEPLWIAGFWFFPFAAAIIVAFVLLASPSEAPDFVILVITLAFTMAFVGLLIRGAIRRPPHPR